MAKNEVDEWPMIAIGGSAGSLDVVLTLLPSMPEAFKGSLVLVIHRGNQQASLLVELLSHRTFLQVKEAEDKESIQAGCIYIAPAGYHLLAENSREFSLDSSELVHFSRPSIDVSFESLADVFGSRLTGILLSGANADGAKGLLRIRQMGGYTIAQQPATASVPYMPMQAITNGAAALVLSPEEMVAWLQTMPLHHCGTK